MDKALRILGSNQGDQPSNNTAPVSTWKNDPASDRQLAVMDKAKVQYPPGVTKGEADFIIKGLFERK